MVSILGFIGTPHTMQLQRYLSDGPDGPGYGPAVEVRGRWERHERQIQLTDGRVVNTAGRIKFPASVDPSTGDLLTFEGEQYEVIEVETPAWFDGTPMHHEVMVS